uniref:Uncharacterized protein n=1 Tax=Oryza glumipatula TaxID=40148 RepID=A0A0D9ZMI1_9ORYZ
MTWDQARAEKQGDHRWLREEFAGGGAAGGSRGGGWVGEDEPARLRKMVEGYMLLALQAHLPSLHPPICEINKDPSKCEPAQGWNLTLLYLSLLLFAIGEGCMRDCVPALGEDQFSNDDPEASHLRSNFLSWLKSANSLGALIGLVFLVWIEKNLGWDIGFLLCALIVIVGLLIAASGLPFYGMRKLNGSPLTRILQVLVTSSKKRQAAVIDVIELQEISTSDHVDEDGEDKCDSKNICTTRVDEKTEAITRMLPIFISCIFAYLPFTLLMTLTIQVGSTMDSGIGMIQIPSASLIAIPTTFHMLMQPRILIPLLRIFTGHTNGITPLQHIGVASACGIMAACIAMLVEAKRLMVVEQQGLTLVADGVPMSVFWLVMQFFLLSIMDIAYIGGLVQFIKSEAPEAKHIAPAVQSLLVGIAAWSGCAFVQLVNRMTRLGDNGRGWLDGTNFNRTRLDRFFLLLATFELVAFINYAFWARRYANKKRSEAFWTGGEILLIERCMEESEQHVLTVVTSTVNVPNMLNMVTYLHGTMHMGISSSSTTVTNVLGATSGFALLGAFLSDSYITRARTILLFGPLEFLGYGLLALQAYLPSLRPPPCNAEAEVSSCREVHGRNAVLLYAALYISAFGDGFMRACMPPLGADQFDHEDPSESRQQSSFFNWYTFGISFGGFIGLILIVWLENSKGWDVGFGVCAFLILLGLLVVAAGLPLYRNHVPEGSPLTRILQVLVVAFKNRKLQLPEKLEEAQEERSTEQGGSTEVTEIASQTNSSLKFLDKACINGGKDGAWSVCSTKNVEETKAVLRVLPVFISSLIGYMSNPLLFTFTVQQGGLTNTRLGRIHVSPATLFIIPSAFQMALLPVYDRFLVPLLRRRTGYASGVTHLQRVGAGFAAVILASAIAAVVERKRREAMESGEITAAAAAGGSRAPPSTPAASTSSTGSSPPSGCLASSTTSTGRAGTNTGKTHASSSTSSHRRITIHLEKYRACSVGQTVPKD